MKGINIAEQCHIVNALAPVSAAGGKTCEYVSMAGYGHLTAVITLGAAVDETTITAYRSADNAGTGEHAIAFRYYMEETASTDVVERQTDAGVGGFTTAVGAAGSIYVIEVDAAELGEDHPYFGLKLSDPGGAQLASVVYILSGGTYQEEATASVLA